MKKSKFNTFVKHGKKIIRVAMVLCKLGLFIFDWPFLENRSILKNSNFEMNVIKNSSSQNLEIQEVNFNIIFN